MSRGQHSHALLWLGIGLALVLAACDKNEPSDGVSGAASYETVSQTAPIQPEMNRLLSELDQRGALPEDSVFTSNNDVQAQWQSQSEDLNFLVPATTPFTSVADRRTLTELINRLRELLGIELQPFRWHGDGDSRSDLFELPSLELGTLKASVLQQNADAVFALIPKARVRLATNVTFRSRTYKDQYDVCSTETFLNQPVAATCSSFLVSPNRLVTAAHCVEADDGSRSDAIAQSLFAVRGYSINSTGISVPILKQENVFPINRILSYRHTTDEDWAILELSGAVPSATLLQLRQSGQIHLNDKVHTFGFPVGLPMKFAYGGKVTRTTVGKPWFIATVDTFSGNSGSPIINDATGDVEGILTDVFGNWFKTCEPGITCNDTSGASCQVPLGCPLDASGCDTDGEQVTRIASVVRALAAIDSVALRNGKSNTVASIIPTKPP